MGNGQDKSAEHQAKLDALTKEKELLDKEKDLILSRKALEDLKNPPKDHPEKVKAAADAAKAVADKQKAQADAEKAAAEAKLAAAKAMFPGIDLEGQTGTVTTEGDKVGVIEARLLGTAAINEAAQKIALEVEKVNDGKPVLVFARADIPDFATLTLYRARIAIVKGALEEALAMAPVVVVPEVPALLPIAGTVLQSISNVLSFFRTDYTVGGVDVSVDDAELVAATAQAIKTQMSAIQVRVPALFNPQVAAPQKLIESEFLKTMRYLAVQRSNAERESAQLEKVIEKAGEDGGREAEKEKRDALQAAIASYDGLVTSLTAVDAEEGRAPLYDLLVEQELYEDAAKKKHHFLVVKVHKAGGGYLIKKNLWTGLGAMPLYHMGGATVSYIMMKGDTGEVEVAGAIPIHGGFVKAGKVRMTLRGQSSARGRWLAPRRLAQSIDSSVEDPVVRLRVDRVKPG